MSRRFAKGIVFLLVMLLPARFLSPALAQPNVRWLLSSPASIASFSPDGEWMLTSFYPNSVLWNVVEQKPAAIFTGWRSVFLESRLFAVHNGNRQLDVYDFPSLRRVYRIVKRLNVEEMGEVVLSADGSVIVVASQSGVRGYRVADGQVLFHFPIHV